MSAACEPGVRAPQRERRQPRKRTFGQQVISAALLCANSWNSTEQCQPNGRVCANAVVEIRLRDCPAAEMRYMLSDESLAPTNEPRPSLRPFTPLLD